LGKNSPGAAILLDLEEINYYIVTNINLMERRFYPPWREIGPKGFPVLELGKYVLNLSVLPGTSAGKIIGPRPCF
jgi:hypothetical protein